jgi:hypothetical protein
MARMQRSGRRWLPKAAKSGAFTATTVVSGFLFAFALSAVSPSKTLQSNSSTTSTRVSKKRGPSFANILLRQLILYRFETR